MTSSKDQEHDTVRQTPDSVSLPSPAQCIIRTSYRRSSHGLDFPSSRENAGRIVIRLLEKGANHQERAYVFGVIIGSISRPFKVHAFPSTVFFATTLSLTRNAEAVYATKPQSDCEQNSTECNAKFCHTIAPICITLRWKHLLPHSRTIPSGQYRW